MWQIIYPAFDGAEPSDYLYLSPVGGFDDLKRAVSFTRNSQYIRFEASQAHAGSILWVYQYIVSIALSPWVSASTRYSQHVTNLGSGYIIKSSSFLLDQIYHSSFRISSNKRQSLFIFLPIFKVELCGPAFQCMSLFINLQSNHPTPYELSEKSQ